MAIKLGTTDITQVKLGANTINEIYQGSTLIYSAGPGPAIDPDAQAFLTATGITDPTQESAVNQLVLDLKSANIWSKMQIIYPIVGGTATTHKYNLKDPQDTDAAFRLTFTGTFIHDASGARASSSYANTHWIPSNQSFANGVHMSANISVDAGGGYNMGIAGGGGGDWGILNGYIGARDYWQAGTGGWLTNIGDSPADWIAGSANGTNFRALYDDGVQVVSDASGAIGAANTIPLYLWAVNNNGSAGDRSNDTLDFITIGEYLDSTEMSALYTAVVDFNTTLGR